MVIGRSVHAVDAKRERERASTREERERDGTRNVTTMMRVTRHDAAVSRQNVLRVTADECDDTSRLFIAHRKAADRWHRSAALACPREPLPPGLPATPGGMEWLMELYGISRTIRTSWIIPLTRQLRFNDRHRILMTNIA